MTDGGVWQNREVLLASGARAPLLEVVSALMLIDSFLAGSPQERGLVAALRKGCLTDRPLPEPIARPLIEAGAVRDDRTVDPVVRQVVLTSVRGEGDGLTVVSPYTDPLDRAVSDLLISR